MKPGCSFKSERVSLERVFKFERLFKSERLEVPRVWEEDYKKKILDFFYPEHNLDLNPSEITQIEEEKIKCQA